MPSVPLLILLQLLEVLYLLALLLQVIGARLLPAVDRRDRRSDSTVELLEEWIVRPCLFSLARHEVIEASTASQRLASQCRGNRKG